MATLTRSIAALLLAASSPAHADQVDRWRPMIEEASARFGIPTTWIERVIRAESRGFTMLRGRPIRSRAGAMGLMQLMPATWAEMRSRLVLGDDPDDPRDNILAGTFYLRLMYDRFGYPGMFGAYNAGPGTYAAYLASRRSLPGETVAYLATVASPSPVPAPIERKTVMPATLFAVRNDVGSTKDAAGSPAPSSSLFVALSAGN